MTAGATGRMRRWWQGKPASLAAHCEQSKQWRAALNEAPSDLQDALRQFDLEIIDDAAAAGGVGKDRRAYSNLAFVVGAALVGLIPIRALVVELVLALEFGCSVRTNIEEIERVLLDSLPRAIARSVADLQASAEERYLALDRSVYGDIDPTHLAAVLGNPSSIHFMTALANSPEPVKHILMNWDTDVTVQALAVGGVKESDPTYGNIALIIGYVLVGLIPMRALVDEIRVALPDSDADATAQYLLGWPLGRIRGDLESMQAQAERRYGRLDRSGYTGLNGTATDASSGSGSSATAHVAVGQGGTDMTAEPAGNVLPIYFVADESGSMASVLDEVNQGLTSLLDAIQTETMAAAKIRFSVIGFSDEAVRHLPPSDLRQLERMPTLTVRGGTSYSAIFRALRKQIPEDVAELKRQGYLVNRPAVFFLTDGFPLDEGWREALAELKDPNFKERPNIIAFGIGEADPATIVEVASNTDFAYQAAVGTKTGEAIKRFSEKLTQSVVNSGQALAGGRAELQVERPEGFTMAVDLI